MIKKMIQSDPLALHSLKVITENQNISGAYIAAPSFEQYRFAWLRDGAFCALAAFVAGDTASAAKFQTWAVDTILKHEELFINAIAILDAGHDLSPEDSPPTRFLEDGSLEKDHHTAWPNFQLDGYGTWIAVLNQTQTLYSEKDIAAVRIVADFLLSSWMNPCYDCWEEEGGKVHGSTLLAIVGGLQSASDITGDPIYLKVSRVIREYIEREFVIDGHFIKHSGSPAVDASLAWAALPHHAYELDNPILQKTLEVIARDLRTEGGGVKRYLGDTYYGGSDWVLLEALFAWNLAASGDRAAFDNTISWMRKQVDINLDLPEQVLNNPQDAEMIKPWEKLWGMNAQPLLWSHAMYLLLLNEGVKNQWI